MKKLWKLSLDHRSHHSCPHRVGRAWQEGELEHRHGVLEVYWEERPQELGDFLWVGIGPDLIVHRRVVRALHDAEIQGFEPREVRVASGSVRPEDPGRLGRWSRGQPIDLFDFWVTGRGEVDFARSTVTPRRREDGRMVHDFHGMARRETVWDPVHLEASRRLRPRTAGAGVFARSTTDVFRIPEAPAWILVTQRFKDLVEDAGFTGVTFLEYGEDCGSDA